jgi:hypothetical protein
MMGNLGQASRGQALFVVFRLDGANVERDNVGWAALRRHRPRDRELPTAPPAAQIGDGKHVFSVMRWCSRRAHSHGKVSPSD